MARDGAEIIGRYAYDNLGIVGVKFRTRDGLLARAERRRNGFIVGVAIDEPVKDTARRLGNLTGIKELIFTNRDDEDLHSLRLPSILTGARLARVVSDQDTTRINVYRSEKSIEESIYYEVAGLEPDPKGWPLDADRELLIYAQDEQHAAVTAYRLGYISLAGRAFWMSDQLYS